MQSLRRTHPPRSIHEPLVLHLSELSATTTAGPLVSAAVRMTARVSGFVQGVGYRWFVRREAARLGLSGSAVNAPDGSVDVIAEGPRAACEALVDLMRGEAHAPGRVERVTVEWGEPRGLRGFVIG